MLSRTIVTLNIEARDIRFLVARGRRVLSWGSIPLADGVAKHGLIADPARVSSALNTLFTGKRIPRQGVVASLSGLRSTLRVVSLPRMKARLLGEAIQLECEKEMSVPLDELYLFHRPLGAKGSEQRFLTVGIPREVLDTAMKTLALASVRPRTIYLKPLALAQAVNREEALIINLEQETFDLVLVMGSVPIINRTITFRGEDIPLQEKVRQLMDELSRTAAFYNASHPERPLRTTTPVVVSGILANDADACNLIKAATANPIERLAPSMECPPELPLPQYAVNIGLALGQATGRIAAGRGAARLAFVNPNLIPTRYKPQPLSLRGLLYPAVSVAFIALLVFMFQVKTSSDADIVSILGELDGVYQQIADTSQTVTTMSEALNKTVAEADKLAEELEAYLAAPSASDLTRILKLAISKSPQGVELTSIEETSEHIYLGGHAADEMSVPKYALALEQTGVFSKVYVASLKVDEGIVAFTIKCIFNGNAPAQ